MKALAAFFIVFLTTPVLTAAPQYCASPANSNAIACVGANPAYCSSQDHSEALACLGTHPSFCSSEKFANSLACLGASAVYCNSEANRDALACLPFDPAGLSLPGGLTKVCSLTKNKLCK